MCAQFQRWSTLKWKTHISSLNAGRLGDFPCPQLLRVVNCGKDVHGSLADLLRSWAIISVTQGHRKLSYCTHLEHTVNRCEVDTIV